MNKIIGNIAIACLLCSAGTVAAAPLKVCADPDYLPYSNKAGQGFENAAAEVVARALNRPLEYVWVSYRQHGGFGEFLANGLDKKVCDVVMSMPYGNRDELTTEPYYISSYVFISRKDRNYSLDSMDAEALRSVKIGYEQDTPPEPALKVRGLLKQATAYEISEHAEESPRTLLDAVHDGKVDVMITWQPAIGDFLSQYPDLTTATVANDRTMGAPEQFTFPMSMAVGKDNTALKQQLDAVVKSQQAQLEAALKSRGVQLFGESRLATVNPEQLP